DLRSDGADSRVPSAGPVREERMSSGPRLSASASAESRASGLSSLALGGAIAVLFALLPLVLSAYQVSVATEILIFALLAVSIDVLAGYAGRTPLGHGAIFGAS